MWDLDAICGFGGTLDMDHATLMVFEKPNRTKRNATDVCKTNNKMMKRAKM